MKNSIVLVLFVAAFFLSINSCKKDDQEGTSKVNILLTDAPGDYDQVNIDIQGIEINSHDEKWVQLTVKKGIYNLLDFTNGLDTLIASGDIPSGKISEIRFILGTNNSIVIDGNTYPLETPSSQQSGLKLKLHETLNEGISYTFRIDFDAAKSIVQTGRTTYILKPVLRLVSEANSGAIKGVVYPYNVRTQILAISGTDTFGTFTDTSHGRYLLQGVTPGAYSLVFSPSSPYSDTTINGVTVTLGNVTTVDTLYLK